MFAEGLILFIILTCFYWPSKFPASQYTSFEEKKVLYVMSIPRDSADVILQTN